MNERADERSLSTADMVAAADRPNGNSPEITPAGEQRNGDWGNGHTATAEMARSADSINRDSAPLLGSDESAKFRSNWDSIQTSFVDEPRQAVEKADSLVAESIKRLAEIFAEERSRLEQQWSRGDEVDTDDLRQAMLRYRSFFQRLLSV